MPSFDVEFEVYCNTCGSGLCNQSEGTRGRTRDALQVRVDVCQKCVDDAVHDAVNEARDDLREEKDREIAELEEQIAELQRGHTEDAC